MDGDILIESEEGQGAQFIFNFILDISTERIEPEKQVNKKDVSHLKILVAEDNRINQVLIKTILKKLGITPVVVENGAQAVKVVQEQNFDLILMDCQMPVLDGYQATEQIRKIPHLQNLPIFALTADVNTESKNHALNVGFTEHLSKPINIEQLIKHLQNI